MDLDAAIEQLRSHDIKTLFIETLGWQSLEESAIAGCKPIQKFQQRCEPVAFGNRTVVWQVLLTDDALFSLEMRRSLYGSICQETDSVETVDASLLVVVSTDKMRSFWFLGTEESAVYVVGQSIALWEFRLKRLAQLNAGLFACVERANVKYETFNQLLKGLFDGIRGISNRADREDYALLTVQRLILIQTIQAKGWLNGDTWYLQTRFGEALQQGENLFFMLCLQPLYRSFALPVVERSLALNTTIGSVPFLGRWFDEHRLEKTYGDEIAVDDRPFEAILGWLSEQSSGDLLNPFMSGDLGYLLERYWRQRVQPKSAYVGGLKLARSLSDRTLEQLILSRTDQSLIPFFLQQEKTEKIGLNDLLFHASSKLCRHLIQDVLTDLRILDPACGSGSLLVSLHQQLLEVFSVLTGYIQQKQDTQLKMWRLSMVQEAPVKGDVLTQSDVDIYAYDNSLLLNIQKRLLKTTLYGVDISSGAVETAQFHLLMHLVATAQQAEALEPLIDLSFNVMTGNSLIGLITVDEERFDQVNKTGPVDILQGDLLQPLAADGYQTTLAEKNLALEHYKSRNHMLAQAKNIPAYARASLLREEILQLDIKAQSKLNTHLLSQMSQQMGIQYKAMQLADKPLRRPLNIEDVDVLQPFHWGYHFNTIIERGGFDAIVCAPPWGALRPTVEEFLQRFQDLAETKGLDSEKGAKLLKTSKQSLAKGDPDIAQAWLFYQDQYAYAADYFYRSQQYAHQRSVVNGKTTRSQLVRERLFIEQCLNLLGPDGLVAVALPGELADDLKARSLFQHLQERGRISEQWLKCDADEMLIESSVVCRIHSESLENS